jgi:DSF synthase
MTQMPGTTIRKMQSIQLSYEAREKTIWAAMNPVGIPCFTPACLEDISATDQWLMRTPGSVVINGELFSYDHYVGLSSNESFYSLGGSLSTLLSLIRAKNYRGLFQYASACLDCLQARLLHFNSDYLTTISLIRGYCLGGGLESALASDIVVVESNSTLGFPEIEYNLFPGMGAFSLLSRRIGTKSAEELLARGQRISIERLVELNLIDKVTEPGTGIDTVREFIRSRKRYCRADSTIRRLKDFSGPLSLSRGELNQVAEAWVRLALSMQRQDIDRMEKVEKVQRRLFEND